MSQSTKRNFVRVPIASEREPGETIPLQLRLPIPLLSVKDIPPVPARIPQPMLAAEPLDLECERSKSRKSRRRSCNVRHRALPFRQASARVVTKSLAALRRIPAPNWTGWSPISLRLDIRPGIVVSWLSVAMIEHVCEPESRAHDWDLVLHLVGSHHGWCRPADSSQDDPESFAVTLDHADSPDSLSAGLSGDTRHRLARLDSGVSHRFWRLNQRYGW